MTRPAYPLLADFMGGVFHQDFYLDGNSVVEVVGSFRDVSSAGEREALCAEIDRFLGEHAEDLDRAFFATFNPDIDPVAFSGSTRAFLEEVKEALETSRNTTGRGRPSN